LELLLSNKNFTHARLFLNEHDLDDWGGYVFNNLSEFDSYMINENEVFLNSLERRGIPNADRTAKAAALVKRLNFTQPSPVIWEDLVCKVTTADGLPIGLNPIIREMNFFKAIELSYEGAFTSKKALRDCFKMCVECITTETYSINFFAGETSDRFRDSAASLLEATRLFNDIILSLDNGTYDIDYIPIYHSELLYYIYNNVHTDFMIVNKTFELIENFYKFIEIFYGDLFSSDQEALSCFKACLKNDINEDLCLEIYHDGALVFLETVNGLLLDALMKFDSVVYEFCESHNNTDGMNRSSTDFYNTFITRYANGCESVFGKFINEYTFSDLFDLAFFSSDANKHSFYNNYIFHRLLETDNVILLPTNVNIKLSITASDVIHSWAVPSLGVKVDAIPGRINEAWIYIKFPGLYYGQCSELCGVNHAFMPISIEAVSMFEFEEKLDLSFLKKEFVPLRK
jgi:hypothetical protein